MKNLVASATILSSILLQTTFAFTCPSPDGRFPDPIYSRKYYHCTGGIPYSKNCLPGLVYDAQVGKCEWQKDLKCDIPCIPDQVFCCMASMFGLGVGCQNTLPATPSFCETVMICCRGSGHSGSGGGSGGGGRRGGIGGRRNSDNDDDDDDHSRHGHGAVDSRRGGGIRNDDDDGDDIPGIIPPPN